MKVKTLAQWYGSNRLLASKVGELLEGCEWAGIVFAGGMSEIPHIKARTIVVNDLHEHICDLAEAVAHPPARREMVRRLRALPFHPRTLKEAQRRLWPSASGRVSERNRWQNAEDYFVVAWMTRAGSAGTDAEKTAGLCLRWDAGGGDSVKRFHSAIDSLEDWAKEFQRCSFSCLDAFKFLDKCKDEPRHGIYADPPFFGPPGKKYSHNAGKTEADQFEFHANLEAQLREYQFARVVVRAYDVPDIRTLYETDDWTWHELEGRKQTNATAPEVLIVRN